MEEEEDVSLSANDEGARRIASLYLRFVNAARPIPTADIYRDFYPGSSAQTAKRAFQRDRAELALCGLVVQDVGGKDVQGGLWQVDEARSFSETDSLSPEDARVLDALCLPLVDDPSFPLRNELRSALAKVDRAFSGTAVLTVAAPGPEGKVLAVMNRCRGMRRPVRVAYADAAGHESERVLDIYGSFSMRGRTYFVCAQEGADGAPGAIRTYRLDRIRSAREVKERVEGGKDWRAYQVPDDFSVEEYRRLPFQMGPSSGRLRLLVPPAAASDVDPLARRSGRISPASQEDVAQAPRQLLGAAGAPASWQAWSVDASDLAMAGAWCVGMGLVPLSPAEAAAAWRAALEEASCQQARPIDDGLDALTAVPARRPAARRGRPGKDQEVRDLLALLSALSKAGDAIDAATVSQRLGIPKEEAKKLLYLLVTASAAGTDGEEGGYLSVSYEDLDHVTLAFDEGVHGRPVRLTPLEAHAIEEALREAGLEGEDDFAQALHQAIDLPTGGGAGLGGAISERVSASRPEGVLACAQAVADGRLLRFSYQKPDDERPTDRLVRPIMVVKSGDHWHLQAQELGSGAPKTFRVDRMGAIRAVSPEGATPLQDPANRMAVADAAPATVRVTFRSRRPLDLFWWEGLHELGHGKDGLLVELPRYGGSWLARHLAACGADVILHDEGTAREVRDYAQRMLGKEGSA